MLIWCNAQNKQGSVLEIRLWREHKNCVRKEAGHLLDLYPFVINEEIEINASINMTRMKQ